MDRKGVIEANVFYFLALAAFVGLMIFYIGAQKDGGAIWADFYAKEIVKIVDSGMAGESVVLNVQKPTSIALKNGLGLSEVFVFDNANNRVCVKLSKGKSTCYSYFNDVDVVFKEIKVGVPENVLMFEIVEKKREAKR